MSFWLTRLHAYLASGTLWDTANVAARTMLCGAQRRRSSFQLQPVATHAYALRLAAWGSIWRMLA
jgi:hypothetical protein